MADPPLPRRPPIVLVGMMGAGKSTVGPILARRLELPFFDSDEEVERTSGKSIEQMFASGDEAFRAEERRVLAQLVAGPASVIAAGGGAVLDGGTRALMLERCTAVWLEAKVETLARRLAGTSDRPLLAEGEPGPILRQLIVEREQLYASAPIHVETGDEPPEETAARIARALTASAPAPAAERDRATDCRA